MKQIGIIGAGNMGESILKALLNGGLKKDRVLFAEAKKERAGHIKKTYGVRQAKNAADLAKGPGLVILAVKPQDAKKVLQGMASSIENSTVIVSIMAGVTISNILSLLGKPVKIVRVMPNIAIKVGEGVIGVAAGTDVTREEMKAVAAMFSSMGLVVEVGEDLMDAVTSLGASSPAFFLLFLEAMIDAGVKIGMPRDKARAICVQVIKGTLAMLEEEQVHPTVMREMITSPGGTTIAGLAVLEGRAFKGSVIDAIEKACKRSRELSL